MVKKLYGTDPDQVPTNADLGDMAYQNGRNLAKIKAQQVEIESGAAQSDLYLRTNDDTHYDWRITNEGNVNRVRFLGAKDGLTTIFPAFINGDTGGTWTFPEQPSWSLSRGSSSYYTTTSSAIVPFYATSSWSGRHKNNITDNGSGKVTVLQAGRYLINVNVYYRRSTPTNDGYLYVRINGSADIWGAGSYAGTGTYYNGINMNYIADLDANDYIEVFAGGNIIEIYGASTFSGYLLG